MEYTLISKEIKKDINFCNSLSNAVKLIYDNENMVELYNKNNVILKGIIYPIQNSAYFVVKEDDRYSLYTSSIDSYILKEHTNEKDILSHTFSYGGIDLTQKLKFFNVIPVLSWEDYFKNISNEDFKNKSEDEIYEMLIANRNSYNKKITNNLSYLKNSLEFLNNIGYHISFNEEHLISYTKTACKSYKTKIPDLFLKINFLNSLNYTPESKFEYNDLDNYIWRQNKYILVENQNIIFICDYIDNENMKVLHIIKDLIPSNTNDKEYIENFITNINNKNIINDYSFIIENNELTYIDEVLFYIFELDVNCGVECIEEENNQSYVDYNDVDIDTNSVKYMRDYFYTVYEYDRFAFCNHIFLVLGGGIDYDSDTGSFTTISVKFLTEVKECPLNGNYKNHWLYGKFNDYVKITYLNDGWINELTWFFNAIKNSSDTLSIINKIEIEEILDSIAPFIQ